MQDIQKVRVHQKLLVLWFASFQLLFFFCQISLVIAHVVAGDDRATRPLRGWVFGETSLWLVVKTLVVTRLLGLRGAQ